MTIGFMEVHLLKAKGLYDSDIFGRIDPYVVLQYKGQEQRSSVAKGQGRNPVWNEKFIFRVEESGGGRNKLVLKIMDKDKFSANDFLGQAIVYVEEIFGVENGEAKKPLKYRVVRGDGSYYGEIDVSISFIPKAEDKYSTILKKR